MTIDPPRIEFHARREAEGLWIVSCAALGIDFSANSLQEAYDEVPKTVALWGCLTGQGGAPRRVSWQMVVEGA